MSRLTRLRLKFLLLGIVIICIGVGNHWSERTMVFWIVWWLSSSIFYLIYSSLRDHFHRLKADDLVRYVNPKLSKT